MSNATQLFSPTAGGLFVTDLQQSPVQSPNPPGTTPLKSPTTDEHPRSISEQNPAAVYLAGLGSAASRRTMRQALDTIAGLVSGNGSGGLDLDWSTLRFQHTMAVRAELARSYAPASCNKILAALRGTLKAAWKLGQMSVEDYRQAVSVENVEGKAPLAGRDIPADEVTALMNVCLADSSPSGARDAAIIGVLDACGLRRSELVALDLADYDQATKTLTVRRHEKEDDARSKRGKERLVYLTTSGAVDALADWLALRGNEPGPLFFPVLKGGAIKRRRMTAQAMWKRVKRRAEQAGIKDLSPRDFRRTFVSDLLDIGVATSTVAKLAGHSSAKITVRYDRQPEATKRKPAQCLCLPHRRVLAGGREAPGLF